MLDEILKVKNIREDKAVKQLAEAELEKKRKEAVLRSKRRALQEYHQWRVTEEDRIYEEIFGEQVRLLDVEAMRESISMFRLKEQDKEEEVSDAKKKLEQAQKDVESAQTARMDAFKNVEKFEEYIQVLERIANIEKERKEETESEEFNVRSPLPRFQSQE